MSIDDSDDCDDSSTEIPFPPARPRMRGLLSFFPFGRPMTLRAGRSSSFQRSKVASSHDRPFQTSRIALPLTPYFDASRMLAQCRLASPCAFLSWKMSRACCLVRTTLGRSESSGRIRGKELESHFSMVHFTSTKEVNKISLYVIWGFKIIKGFDFALPQASYPHKICFLVFLGLKSPNPKPAFM